jgi:hypothetical protein
MVMQSQPSYAFGSDQAGFKLTSHRLQVQLQVHLSLTDGCTLRCTQHLGAGCRYEHFSRCTARVFSNCAIRTSPGRPIVNSLFGLDHSPDRLIVSKCWVRMMSLLQVHLSSLSSLWCISPLIFSASKCTLSSFFPVLPVR